MRETDTHKCFYTQAYCRCEKQTYCAAAECVKEAVFVRQLFLKEENSYADEERPVDDAQTFVRHNAENMDCLVNDIPECDP